MPGAALGSKDAKQWCIPWGYELNSITYNRKMYEKAGVEPPKNMPDLVEKSAKLTKDLAGPYGIGVRGSRSWATIHPGFLSGYSNYGQKDLTVSADGKLKAAMDTAESKAYHKLFVDMVQNSWPEELVDLYPYQVGYGSWYAGASATIFDADILGYFMNGGDNKEKGNLGFHAFAANPDAKAPTPNVWIWSLAMNAFGTQKDAAWYFMQWASSTEHDMFGATKMDFVNPVRAVGRHQRRLQDQARQILQPAMSISWQPRRPARKSTSRRNPCSSTSRPHGRRRCRRWSPRKCRSTTGSINSPRPLTSSSEGRRPGLRSIPGTPRRAAGGAHSPSLRAPPVRCYIAFDRRGVTDRPHSQKPLAPHNRQFQPRPTSHAGGGKRVAPSTPMHRTMGVWS